MKDRRTLVWLVALAIAAGITQFLVWWLRPPPRPIAMVGPPRSSYVLDNFTLRAFGSDGHLAFTMTAPHLARREGNDSLYINAPVYQLRSRNGGVWYGTSQYAWVSADNSLVKLLGTVEMQRPAVGRSGAAEIYTADATVWTQDKRMASAAPSEIQEPGRILRGTGMKADFNTRTLELLADVHATLTPRPRPHP